MDLLLTLLWGAPVWSLYIGILTASSSWSSGGLWRPGTELNSSPVVAGMDLFVVSKPSYSTMT